MSIWRLVIREIAHRKINFSLGLLSVVVASACLAGALTLLQAHDLRTDRLVAAKEQETKAEMADVQDDYRKIMKLLGFNMLILPKDQNLGDLYAEDYASKYMPESYVDSLVHSGTMIIRHLLPSLQQKITWPERRRTIILIGVRGEVPLDHVAPKEPIQTAVPPGTMVVGYELHRSLGLSKGDEVELLDRSFTVGTLNEERGSKDDITIWIDLDEAQELLKKEGLINGILALKCLCEGSDLAALRAEVARLLPETQAIEFGARVLTREEARYRAAEIARKAVASEKAHRAGLRAEQEAFASILVPLVLVACAVSIGVLFLNNVRERRTEIGLLRALGVQSTRILVLFLARALLMGLAGGVIGYGAGFVTGAVWSEGGIQGTAAFFDASALLQVVGLALALAGLASWLPAVSATRQDPADVLADA